MLLLLLSEGQVSLAPTVCSAVWISPPGKTCSTVEQWVLREEQRRLFIYFTVICSTLGGALLDQTGMGVRWMRGGSPQRTKLEIKEKEKQHIYSLITDWLPPRGSGGSPIWEGMTCSGPVPIMHVVDILITYYLWYYYLICYFLSLVWCNMK